MSRRTITILCLIQNVMGEVVRKTCAAFYLRANVLWGDAGAVRSVAGVMDQRGSLKQTIGKAVSTQSERCARFQDTPSISLGLTRKSLMGQRGV